MLDALQGTFKKELQFSHTAAMIQRLSDTLGILNIQFMKDAEAKNAAIDLICQILQSNKEVPPQESPCCPVTPCPS